MQCVPHNVMYALFNTKPLLSDTFLSNDESCLLALDGIVQSHFSVLDVIIS